MDRRRFLTLFAAAAVVAPVAPKYFFAPARGWRFMGADWGFGPSYSVITMRRNDEGWFLRTMPPLEPWQRETLRLLIAETTGHRFLQRERGLSPTVVFGLTRPN